MVPNLLNDFVKQLQLVAKNVCMRRGGFICLRHQDNGAQLRCNNGCMLSGQGRQYRWEAWQNCNSQEHSKTAPINTQCKWGQQKQLRGASAVHRHLRQGKQEAQQPKMGHVGAPSCEKCAIYMKRPHVVVYCRPHHGPEQNPTTYLSTFQLLVSAFSARATSSRLLPLLLLRLPRVAGALAGAFAPPVLRPALATAGSRAGAGAAVPSASSMLSMLSRTALRIALICLRAAT